MTAAVAEFEEERSLVDTDSPENRDGRESLGRSVNLSAFAIETCPGRKGPGLPSNQNG